MQVDLYHVVSNSHMAEGAVRVRAEGPPARRGRLLRRRLGAVLVAEDLCRQHRVSAAARWTPTCRCTGASCRSPQVLQDIERMTKAAEDCLRAHAVGGRLHAGMSGEDAGRRRGRAAGAVGSEDSVRAARAVRRPRRRRAAVLAARSREAVRIRRRPSGNVAPEHPRHRRNPRGRWRAAARRRALHPADGVHPERRDGGGVLPRLGAARLLPDRQRRRRGDAERLHLSVARGGRAGAWSLDALCSAGAPREPCGQRAAALEPHARALLRLVVGLLLTLHGVRKIFERAAIDRRPARGRRRSRSTRCRRSPAISRSWPGRC